MPRPIQFSGTHSTSGGSLRTDEAVLRQRLIEAVQRNWLVFTWVFKRLMAIRRIALHRGHLAIVILFSCSVFAELKIMRLFFSGCFSGSPLEDSPTLERYVPGSYLWYCLCAFVCLLTLAWACLSGHDN